MTLSHSTVTDLFTDIASTIRSKTGSNSPIVADAFPTAIDTIHVASPYAIAYETLALNAGSTQHALLNHTTPVIFSSSGSVATVNTYLSMYIPSDFFNSISYIGNGGFAYRDFYLSESITFQNCTWLGADAFRNNPNRTTGNASGFTLNFPNLEILDAPATFYGCKASHIYLPNLLSMSETVYNTEGQFASCWKLLDISLPKLTNIPPQCFAYCSSLSMVNFPRVSKIGVYAFSGCSVLTSVTFPSCTILGSYVFANCSALETVSFPSCTTIGSCAFSGCRSLTTVSFPLCQIISTAAFQACRSLLSVSFPSCTTIYDNAFSGCSALISANFPACTSIGFYAFSGCSALISTNFPVCTSIGAYAFTRCSSLATVNFPVCISIGSYVFSSCAELVTVSLPACTYINSYAFGYCYNLLSLYLMGSSLCSLANTNAFMMTPISTYTTSTGGVYGSIYVPNSLLASYKTATNWITYSDRFVGCV